MKTASGYLHRPSHRPPHWSRWQGALAGAGLALFVGCTAGLITVWLVVSGLIGLGELFWVWGPGVMTWWQSHWAALATLRVLVLVGLLGGGLYGWRNPPPWTL
jgi:hypothetical protein